MSILGLSEVTISVREYRDLIRAEKAYEKIREFLITEEDTYISKDVLLLLADLDIKKESVDNGEE